MTPRPRLDALNQPESWVAAACDPTSCWQMPQTRLQVVGLLKDYALKNLVATADAPSNPAKVTNVEGELINTMTNGQ
jgi:hypothetical protein